MEVQQLVDKYERAYTAYTDDFSRSGRVWDRLWKAKHAITLHWHKTRPQPVKLLLGLTWEDTHLHVPWFRTPWPDSVPFTCRVDGVAHPNNADGVAHGVAAQNILTLEPVYNVRLHSEQNNTLCREHDGQGAQAGGDSEARHSEDSDSDYNDDSDSSYAPSEQSASVRENCHACLVAQIYDTLHEEAGVELVQSLVSASVDAAGTHTWELVGFFGPSASTNEFLNVCEYTDQAVDEALQTVYGSWSDSD